MPAGRCWFESVSITPRRANGRGVNCTFLRRHSSVIKTGAQPRCDRGHLLSRSLDDFAFELLREVFGVATRLGSLNPSHLGSLWPVHLHELGLCRASGEGAGLSPESSITPNPFAFRYGRSQALSRPKGIGFLTTHTPPRSTVPWYSINSPDAYNDDAPGSKNLDRPEFQSVSVQGSFHVIQIFGQLRLPRGQVLWPTVQSSSLRAARWVSLTAPGETRQIGLLVFRRCLLRRFHVQISHQPEQ